VIALNEQHLKRLLCDYVRYYHQDRAHLGLGKGTPNNRSRATASGPILVTDDSAGCTIVTIAPLENQEAGFVLRPETLVLIYIHTDRVKRVGAEVLSTIVGFRAAFPLSAMRNSHRFRSG